MGMRRRSVELCASGMAVLAAAGLAVADAAASGPTVLSTCEASALAHAVSHGGTIDFGLECQDLVLSGTLSVPAGRTVDLEGNGYSVTLIGNGRRLFSVSGGNLTVGGITLGNGRVTGASGASGTQGSSGSSTQAATAGGAGKPGAGARGGAIYIAAGSTVSLTNDTLSNNAAVGGNGGVGGLGGNGLSGRMAPAGPRVRRAHPVAGPGARAVMASRARRARMARRVAPAGPVGQRTVGRSSTPGR